MSENFDLNLPGTIGAFQKSLFKILTREESVLDKRIPVLCENQLDLLSKLEQSVAQSEPGICVIIRTPTLVDTRMSGHLWFDDASVVFRIVENVLLNRESGTKIPAQLAAEQVALSANVQVPDGCGAALIVYRISEVRDITMKNILIYEVSAKTGVGLGSEPTPAEEE